MKDKSHIDISKLNKVPLGHPFEYKDIVRDDFPTEERPIDGLRFKEEVKKGIYEDVVIYDNTDIDNRVVYKKI